MRIEADSTAAVAAAVRDARSAGRTLEIVGSGSRRGYGRPVDADAVLDTSGLCGIVDYDPAELVLTARPGTPMAEIAALVAAHGQHLAFEPPDFAPLWGGVAGAGTLGGALALGLGGSRRAAAGAPRDHFLGFEAVNGLGEVFSAGGKVIKNVTGYDLPKLMAGSLGTLAVLTEVTIKILPAPRTSVSVQLTGPSDTAAIAAMTAALNSPATVSGAAHVPAVAGQPCGTALSVTRLRTEGVAVSVRARAAAVAALLADFGAVSVLEEIESCRAWHDLNDLYRFVRCEEVVWRVSLPPSFATIFVEALDPSYKPRWYYDWGGGLVWLMLPPAGDGHAAMVRNALSATAGADGHATLVRASDEVRRAVPPFQPLEPALAALSERVRTRFDPAGVFNPGRIWAKG